MEFNSGLKGLSFEGANRLPSLAGVVVGWRSLGVVKSSYFLSYGGFCVHCLQPCLDAWRIRSHSEVAEDFNLQGKAAVFFSLSFVYRYSVGLLGEWVRPSKGHTHHKEPRRIRFSDANIRLDF